MKEQVFKAQNGYLYIGVSLAMLAFTIMAFYFNFHQFEETKVWLVIGLMLSLSTIICMSGFFVVDPNESVALVLFGEYKGTVKLAGFWWANPFFTKKKISLRARNMNGEKIKVNDAIGNPIEIAAVIVWQVTDTCKALFEVENYESYVSTQSEAAVRQLAGVYPYDYSDDDHTGYTLRASGEKVNQELEKAIDERLAMAGIKVIEARLAHLAYASEIAGAMLQRQQAMAIVAARQKIVEGAVGMVELAIDSLSKKEIIQLDEERKAAMVSNLMVVLCSDKAVNPVVNTGSLY
jgi:regulator of protease activity HflC (stomatin/prohibitin superfamily)